MTNVNKRTEGNVRTIPVSVAENIDWNMPRGRVGNRRNSDPLVDEACSLLTRGETVLIEESVNERGHYSAFERIELIRSRLGKRIQTTSLNDTQAEELRISPNSEFIPRYAVRLKEIAEWI